MFFRNAFVFAIFFSLGLTACDINLKAKPPTSSLRMKGLNCLSQIAQTVSSYLDDEMSEGEIIEFFSCMQKAFTTFEGHSRGSKVDEYTPDEIRNFLHENFIKDRKISDKLLAEFMLIKKTLVGGSVDVIRREDLHKAVSILETLKKEALRLKPHMRVLNVDLIKHEPSENLSYRINVAHKKLYESIEVFVELLANAQQPYHIQNLEVMLTELQQFVRWREHFYNTLPIQRWMELFRNFKDLTVASNEKITPKEWGPLLTAGANWYMLFLETKTLWKLENLWDKEQLMQINATTLKALRWVKDAIFRQPDKVLKFEKITALYGSVVEMGWVGSTWPKEAVDQIFRAVVTKMLGEANLPPKERKARGVAAVHISRLEQEVMQWYENQVDIEEGILGNLQFLPNRAFYLPEISGVYLSYDMLRDGPMDRFNYTVFNALRSLSNLVIRGYAAQPKLGLTRDELQEVYLDIRGLAVAWNLADPRENKTGKRAYLEGNLFTYSANGNDYLEAPELMQLLALMKSGAQIGQKIYGEARVYCMDSSQDVYGKNSLLSDCVERFLASRLTEFVPNLPSFVKFFNSLPFDQREFYVRDLLETVYGRNSKPGLVESGDITSMTALLHYQESVFTRYNRNYDEELFGQELNDAFENFRWLIKSMAALNCQNLSDSKVRASFDYILRHQQIPEMSLSTLWSFMFEKDPIHIDRIQLSKVFKVIIRKIVDSNGAPQPVCK